METDSAERLASLWFESAPAPHPETSVQERQRRAADLTNFLRDVVVQPEHSALIEKAPPALEQEIGATIYALAGSVLFEVAVLEGSEGLGYACQRLELTGARVAVADHYRSEGGLRTRYRIWSVKPEGGELFTITGQTPGGSDEDADDAEILGRAIARVAGWSIPA